MVGRKGIILHTSDGGATWSPEKSGSDADLMSVSVIKPYGVIGMQLEDVTSGTGAQMHVVRPGSLVATVVPGSPAEKAGLLKGDIVVAIDGTSVKDTEEVIGRIFAMKPGTKAAVGYIRNGNVGTTDVIVGDGSKPFPTASRH